MKVAKDCVVALEYTLHLGDGDIVDRSSADAPLSYLQGHEQIVPGLEQALEGLSVGDQKKVVVPAVDGYGERDEEGVQEVERSAFPQGAELVPGVTLTAQMEDGDEVPFLIRELKGEKVVIDLNHPLAGKTLHFDVKVQSVRAATEEELEHGHVHGAGEEHEHE